MDFNKVLKTRTSIRKYSNKDVKDDKIINAIEAANLAPSPGNLSILKFIIIKDKETIKKIAQAAQQPFIKSAPVVIAVCSDSANIKRAYDIRTEKYVKQQAGAAIQNFLLKITEMKLASCWIGAYSESIIKSALKVPENITIEAILPIAYPHKADKTKQKPKPNLGNITYFETYGNKYQKKPRMTGTH